MEYFPCEFCGHENPVGSHYCSNCREQKKRGRYTPTLSEKMKYQFLPSILAMTTTWEVNGIDVSAWNGDMDMDIASILAKFAFIRAGYGDNYIDIRLEQNRDRAKAAGMSFGLYWFCKPGYSARQHALSFYLKWIENPGNLPPVMDFEWNIAGMTPVAVASWIASCLNEFEALSGVKPMIYTSPGWWNDHVSRNAWAKTYKLWDAHWTTAGAPIIPYDWSGKQFTFWQHSADNNGQGSNYGSSNGDPDMDLDRYYGSWTDFILEFGIDDGEPPEEVVIVPKKLVITTANLNMRSIPGGTGTETDIGTLRYGSDVGITKTVGVWGKVEGWIHLGYTKDK